MEAIKSIDLKTVTKVSVPETLKGIPVGESRRIKSRQIKQSVVRSTLSKLQKEGFVFESTERGLIDEIVVTRKR